jgi:hypothetical protein
LKVSKNLNIIFYILKQLDSTRGEGAGDKLVTLSKRSGEHYSVLLFIWTVKPFILKKLNFFFKKNIPFKYYSSKFIIQYFIDFQLVIIIYLFLWDYRSLKQTLRYLVDTQFLQASIFVIILLNKKIFKKTKILNSVESMI